MPMELGLELLLHVLELLLGHAGGPLIEGEERYEELRIEKPGGVTAVVRPAVLGHDGDHLWVAFENLPHAPYHRHPS